jgi:hypothetical protein
MAEHKHGTMDISEHQKAFAGLIKAATIVCVITAIVLIFLAFVGT